MYARDNPTILLESFKSLQGIPSNPVAGSKACIQCQCLGFKRKYCIYHRQWISLSLQAEAVRNMPKPENVNAVRWLCGFVNYLAKFLPSLAGVLEPIRQLTRNELPWQWQHEHDTAFEKSKSLWQRHHCWSITTLIRNSQCNVTPVKRTWGRLNAAWVTHSFCRPCSDWPRN